jgi:hypothetical protein
MHARDMHTRERCTAVREMYPRERDARL